ncbi:MAG: MFS transporter [Dehalococcoidia bacterium]|jgi:MFS family permease
MKRTVDRELVAIITILGLGSLAMAIPQPILSLYLTDIGITPTILGLIYSMAMVGMIIGEPFLGWVADKVGLKIPLSVGTFICGLAVLCFIFNEDILPIFLISLFWGITRSAIFGPGRGYIGVNAPPMKRATFMAFISVAMACSKTFGALPGGFIADTLGYQWVFIGSCGISCLGGMVVILGLKKTKQMKSQPVAVSSPTSIVPPSQGRVKILRPLVSQGAVAFLYFIGFGILLSFLPLLANQVAGISASGVGVIFTISGLVTMVLSIPMAILADRKGKKIFMIFGLVMLSLAMAGLAFAEDFLWLVIFVILNSIGMAMLEPAALGLISSLVPSERLSTVMGIYGGIFENTGIVAGSALAGFVWSFLGPRATFLIGASTGILGAITCLVFVRENKSQAL